MKKFYEKVRKSHCEVGFNFIDGSSLPGHFLTSSNFQWAPISCGSQAAPSELTYLLLLINSRILIRLIG